MFCITLQGGLGNQLFQYAFGQMLKKHYGTTVLYDDLNYSTLSIFSIGCMLGLYTPRTLQLERFDITIDRPIRRDRIRLGSTGLHKIASMFLGWKNSHRRDDKNPYSYDVDWLTLDPQQDYSCGGYRNVARYYGDMQSKLQSQIVLKHESIKLQDLSATITKQQKDGIQTVSVHVRGGDYIKFGMVVCDIQYYKKALEELQKTISKEKIHLYVFCDDPDNLPIDISLFDDYSSTRIIFDDYYIANKIDQQGFDDVEKFVLMSRCQHHIIANSTYSRWAAWLSKLQGITIAPKMRLKEVSSDEIVPDTWLRI